MIALDTNVIVRLIVGDDPRQVARARKLLSDNDVYVSSGVLIETEWVLRRTYKLSDATMLKSLAGLLGLPNLTVPWPGRVAELLEAFAAGMDFADAVHLMDAQSMGCANFAGFDDAMRKKAARLGLDVAVMTP